MKQIPATDVALKALRVALELLWQNLLEPRQFSDDRVVRRLRRLVRARQAKAIMRTDDSFLGATLRAAGRVILNEHQTPRKRIGELWRILDMPLVSAAVGFAGGKMGISRRNLEVRSRRNAVKKFQLRSSRRSPDDIPTKIAPHVLLDRRPRLIPQQINRVRDNP